MTLETLKVVITAETKKLNDSLKQTNEGLKKTQKEAKKTSSKAGGEFAELGKKFAVAHIAVELIMKAVQKLGQMFKQGLTNMYNYSKAMGGDFAQNVDKLKQSFDYLTNSLGSALMPIIEALLPTVTKIVDGLAGMADKVAQVTSVITGKNTYKKAKKDVEEYTEAVKKATLGFDELNVVDSGKKDNKETANPADMFEEVEIDPKLNSIAGIFDEIAKSVSKAVQGVNDFFKKTDWKKAGGDVASALNGIVDVIDTIFVETDWATIGKSIMESLMGFIETFDWAGLVTTLFDIVSGALKLLTGLIEGIDWDVLFNSIITIIYSTIDNLINGNLLSDLFTTLGTAIGKLLEGAVKLFKLRINIMQKIITAIKDFFSEKIEAAGGDVGQGLLDGFAEIFKNIGQWLMDKIINPLLEGFAKGLGLEGGKNELVKKIEEAWNGVSEWVTNIWNKVSTWFSDMWADLGKWLVDGLNNYIIDPLNELLKAFQLGHIRDGLASIAEWFGASKDDTAWLRENLQIPHVQMAEGGIVERATTALIGENGKEAVIPLENNTDWIDMLAERLSANTPSRISLNVDGKQLGYAVINNINNITKQTGSLQLSLT